MPKHTGWKYGSRNSRGIADATSKLESIRDQITGLDGSDARRLELVARAAELAAIVEVKGSALSGKRKRSQRSKLVETSQGRLALRGVENPEASLETSENNINNLSHSDYKTRSTPQQMQSFLDEYVRTEDQQEASLSKFEISFLDAMSLRLPSEFSPLDYYYAMQSLSTDCCTGVDRYTGVEMPDALMTANDATLKELAANMPAILAFVIGPDFGAEISQICKSQEP